MIRLEPWYETITPIFGRGIFVNCQLGSGDRTWETMLMEPEPR